MAYQRVSIVLSLSSDGNVLDFFIEKSEGLKTELKEASSVKSQRIECEMCKNELELCLWLQKNENLVVEKLEPHPISIKKEPRLESSDSEWANNFEPLLEIEEKPIVMTFPVISTLTKKRGKKRRRKKTKTVSSKVPQSEELQCDHCNLKFLNKRAIAMHLRRKHSGIKKELPEKITCTICAKDVPRKKIRLHLSTHADLAYDCDICHKRFKSKTNIYSHMKLAHLENPNVKVCPFCDKRFLQKSKLVDHVARHENQRHFKCDFCSKDFNTSEAVTLHMIKIHNTEERNKIYCHMCGHVSYNQSGFDLHQLTHLSDKEKPFCCPHCQKGFTRKLNYERHLWIHTGEKPMKCEICSKGYRDKNRLLAHLRNHTGEKPFFCSMPGCDKRYAERSCYRAHIKLHERELNVNLDKSTRKFKLQTHKATLLSNVKKPLNFSK